MKSKIIHVPRRFVKEKWGGTETVIFETSKELIKADYDVEIHTSLILSDKKKETIYGLPVKRYPYFYTYFGISEENKELLDNIGGSFFSFSFFFRLLFMKSVELFHLHTMGRLGGLVRTVSKLRRIPYIVSIHGGVLDMPSEQLQELLKPIRGLFDWGKPLGFLVGSRQVLQDADAIICVGQREKELMQEKFPGKRVVYLPNGVDVEKFEKGDGRVFRRKYGIKEEEKVLFCVSRIDPQKNQFLLIETFKELIKKDKTLKLILIGAITNGPYYEKVKLKIKELSLEDKTIILTDISFDNADLVNAYAAADVFVLPSRHEPFGMVILEAWAAKKPVIASNIGGITDFVEDGKNGLLFENGSETSLGGAMTKIFDDKQLANKLAANGYEESKKYNWKSVTQELISIYEEVSGK